MNGTSTGGTLIPIGVCQFSTRQQIVRSVAVSVELSMCAYSFFASLPPCTPKRQLSRRAW